MGHVHYDIALVQVLQTVKVDRIIMQRSVCRANVCNGLGAIESFYKGRKTGSQTDRQTDMTASLLMPTGSLTI